MTIHRIRLSKMQKIVNVIAVSSGIVSLAVVGSGLYVYVNRDAIVDNIKSRATEAIMGSFGSLGGAAVPSLGDGANDLSPSAPQIGGSAPTDVGIGVPSL